MVAHVRRKRPTCDGTCAVSTPVLTFPWMQDVIPFASFRERAITAASTDPPLLDEDDLCVDLMLKEGLVCWGSAGGGPRGMDAAAPWDTRSWEAKPWFLRKWWWLVGGNDDEMWENTRWWHMMRGEALLIAA